MLIVIAFPVYTNLVNALTIPPPDISVKGYASGVSVDLLKQFRQTLLTLSFLPYQAFLMLDAITVTLERIFISKKNYLEWEVAYYTERSKTSGLRGIILQTAPGIILTCLTLIAILVLAPYRIRYALPFLVLWSASPILVKWLSGARKQSEAKLTNADHTYLAQISWETWNYFDKYLSSEYNYLIPDNIQLAPTRVVAERTSPTNISLSILSVISAYDLGFLTLPATIEKLENIFQTLAKLERSHGHFFNWYQIRTLAPLLPRYISTVDSGNLVGHLVAARSAFTQFSKSTIISEQHFLRLIEQTQFFINHALADNKVFKALANAFLESCPESAKTLPQVLTGLRTLQVFISQIKTINNKFLNPDVVHKFERFILLLEQISHINSFFDWHPLLLENSLQIEQALQSLAQERQTKIRDLYNLTIDNINYLEPTPKNLKEIYNCLDSVLSEINSNQTFN